MQFSRSNYRATALVVVTLGVATGSVLMSQDKADATSHGIGRHPECGGTMTHASVSGGSVTNTDGDNVTDTSAGGGPTTTRGDTTTTNTTDTPTPVTTAPDTTTTDTTTTDTTTTGITTTDTETDSPTDTPTDTSSAAGAPTGPGEATTFTSLARAIPGYLRARLFAAARADHRGPQCAKP